jgi:hypothetical protein
MNECAPPPAGGHGHRTLDELQHRAKTTVEDRTAARQAARSQLAAFRIMDRITLIRWLGRRQLLR